MIVNGIELDSVHQQMLAIQLRTAEFNRELDAARLDKQKEVSIATATITHNNLLEVEKTRQENQKENQLRTMKMEAVRIAQQTLIENRKNKPVGERDVSVTDILEFSEQIINYVNG